MKWFTSALAILFAVFAASAFAGTINIDTQAAKCATVQTTANGSNETSSTCATGAELTALKFNFEKLSILADLSSKDVGFETALDETFKVGLAGGASTESDAGASEKHDSHATVFGKATSSDAEVKLSLTRHQAAGSMDSNGAGISARWYMLPGNVRPFWNVGLDYSQSTVDDSSKLTGSLSFGLRTTLN